ncbi:hypothetical protein ZWY2020_029036 [Hordeum vulgare]|nr:hypothetical protein ZWY2020_029036 [Hordeum vulgare]
MGESRQAVPTPRLDVGGVASTSAGLGVPGEREYHATPRKQGDEGGRMSIRASGSPPLTQNLAKMPAHPPGSTRPEAARGRRGGGRLPPESRRKTAPAYRHRPPLSPTKLMSGWHGQRQNSRPPELQPRGPMSGILGEVPKSATTPEGSIPSASEGAGAVTAVTTAAGPASRELAGRDGVASAKLAMRIPPSPRRRAK